MLRRPSAQDTSHQARHDIDPSLEPFLACCEEIESIATQGGRLHGIQFALDGLAALALFARSQEEEWNIELPTLKALQAQLEACVDVVVCGVWQYASALREAVALESGSSDAGRWKHDPSSRYEGGTRLSKTYTLNFRALQLSTFCESDPTQIVLNPKEPSPKSLIVVHPSSLLFFACKRIVSAPQPSETDLLLLLAIYWFEEDAVLEPGTFFDVEKIKRLTSSSSGSQLWQDMLDKIRSDSVSARIMKLSEVSLGRLIGRTHLINMFGSITRKTSVPHHPGILANKADEHYRLHPVPSSPKEYKPVARPSLFTSMSWFNRSTHDGSSDEGHSPTAPRRPGLHRTTTHEPAAASPDAIPLTRSRSAQTLHHWGAGLRKLSTISVGPGSEDARASGRDRRRT